MHMPAGWQYLLVMAHTTHCICPQDGKDYSRGTNFNCMATSGDGFCVIGAQDGTLRLYSSKTLTRAKTSIPGMGAPITSVDVTYDGKLGCVGGDCPCVRMWCWPDCPSQLCRLGRVERVYNVLG